MRACYPWIDRVRLSGAWHLKQLPDQLVQVRRQRHRQSRTPNAKSPLTSGAFSCTGKAFSERRLYRASAHRATGRLDFACWIIPLYLGLFMQNGAQQRIMNLYLSIVADESKFAEFVHKIAHARSGRSNHLGQCFLADIQWNGLRYAFRPEMREQQQKAGKSLLA